jgi:hypothetical protein
MLARSVGCGFLLATALLCAGCGELDPRRIVARRAADTTQDAESGAATPIKKSEGSRATPAMEAAGFAEIRRSLRRLVTAEETFYAENGAYSEELSNIGADPGKDVTIRFLWLTKDGWAASGTHAAVPDRDCVIFVGQAQSPPTTLKYVRLGRLGVPVCDDRSAPPKSPSVATPKTAPPATPPDTANSLNLLDPRVAMKVDLRNLAHSEDTYLRMQGTYARRPESMALQYLWHGNVRVKILSADGQSWAAKATDTRYPMKSCVIWFGPVPERPRTDAQQRVESRAGEPVCDE